MTITGTGRSSQDYRSVTKLCERARSSSGWNRFTKTTYRDKITAVTSKSQTLANAYSLNRVLEGPQPAPWTDRLAGLGERPPQTQTLAADEAAFCATTAPPPGDLTESPSEQWPP